MPRFRFHLNPITRKRLRRFWEMRRARYSLCLLLLLYGLSLGAELICNDRPLCVRHNGRWYFPVFRFYPESRFLGNQIQTRPDYKALEKSAEFAAKEGNFMVWPLVPYGPYETLRPDQIEIPERVTLNLEPELLVGWIKIDSGGTISSGAKIEEFFGLPKPDVEGRLLAELWQLPAELAEAVACRFRNEAAPRLAMECRRADGKAEAELGLATFKKRRRVPKYVKITFRELGATKRRLKFVFDGESKLVGGDKKAWAALAAGVKETLAGKAGQALKEGGGSFERNIGDTDYKGFFEKEVVRFPFRPVRGHLLGLDDAGRDVFARIFYGLRISMTFGIVLVSCSLFFGTIIGSIQGYFGGLVDIGAQRFTEIWGALPFLYIMILLGSIYGRGFMLLLGCYALFNWIGMSYYMRAEMLRLRKQPFVEAAKCLGLSPARIIFRHILPNALTPLITLFPFSLVGAIGSLAGLDYLGFGLPPPIASWGELLQQAQRTRWAWWLILYSSLSLFVVMLLGVFIGEGVRNAFDPRRYSRLK